MATTGQIQASVVIGGLTVTVRHTDTDKGQEIHTTALAAGVDGSLNGTSYVVTSAGHGFTTNDTLGLFWATGQRIGLECTNSTANTFTLNENSGSGNALPAGTSAVVASVKTLVSDLSFNANTMLMYAESCDQRAYCDLLDANAATLSCGFHVSEANAGLLWNDLLGTNPKTGDVAKAAIYNGSNAAATYRIGVVLPS